MKLPLLLLAVSALYFNASPTEDNPHLFKRLFKACTNFNWKKRNNDLTNRGCACSKPRPKKQELLNNICKLIIKKQHAFPIHQVQYVSIKPQDIPQEPNKIDGGELFVACAENFVKIIHGGVVANNSGKLENGLPYIFNGINGLVQIVSRTPNPEQTLEEVIKFMQEFDNNDYEQLLTIAKSHVTD